MARTNISGPLYQMIVQDIRQKVENRELLAGDRIASIGEICEHYRVSPITAKRAISELQAMGLIRSVKGRGSFVKHQAQPQPPQRTRQAIGKVALVTSSNIAISSRSFFAEIWSSIEQVATEQGMDFRVQVIPDGIHDGYMDVIFRTQSDEGLIFLAPTHAGRVLPRVQERSATTVMIDVALPFTDCVLTDNLQGMGQLINHLKELGHTHLYLATGGESASNATNENERVAAARFLAADRGLKWQTGSSEPGHILAQLRRVDRPTAVLFNQDDPAIRFVEHARQAGLDVPEDVSVTGFDGWTHKPEPVILTTLAVDREGLGRQAVELLRRTKPPTQLICDWVRVPGRLVVGETTAAPPRKAGTRR